MRRCCARDTNEDGNCDKHRHDTPEARRVCTCWRCVSARDIARAEAARRRADDDTLRTELLAQTSASAFDVALDMAAFTPASDPSPPADFGGGDFGGGGASGDWSDD